METEKREEKREKGSVQVRLLKTEKKRGKESLFRVDYRGLRKRERERESVQSRLLWIEKVREGERVCSE